MTRNKEPLVLDVDLSPYLPADRQRAPSGDTWAAVARNPGRKLVRGITAWPATSSPGREVAVVPDPVEFVRPHSQYAVRTPSKEDASGCYLAVVFTSRSEQTMPQAVDLCDGRADVEADLKDFLCQAFRHLKKECSVEGKKTGGFASQA
jgi:hypothetical protein